MPHVTTILGNEAGIQYQGVKDASSVLGVPLINGLIVGQFKRGRMDRPMTITLENIRGTLGHDPDNPDYIAVMDALSAGVPSVQVMRVKSGLDFSNCTPSMINITNGAYDLNQGVLYGMNMTLQTPKGTVSGDFLVPLPEYSNTLHYLFEQYLYENISLISDGPAGQLVAAGGGGSAFMQVYGSYILGGNGSLGGSPFNLILKPLEGAGFDAYGFHFETPETVIHVCGLGEFPGY
ncbi:hypothetical protein [Acinetobacter indicus]|uniref:hypothetical protein n=1 Tax=Acinetobacter indicus TaxID=756892 RepID=UPI00209AB9ED|nr:hypothetical protein [Acinetobacter indicus]MCO8088262.1 hypothetical protein [Acinetobacter indicus]